MNNNYTEGDIPMGFSMALAQNTHALEAFSAMSMDEKRAVIEKARRVTSKKEMNELVGGISGKNRTEIF